MKLVLKTLLDSQEGDKYRFCSLLLDRLEIEDENMDEQIVKIILNLQATSKEREVLQRIVTTLLYKS